MTPKEIVDKMLTLTNELCKLTKELEDQMTSGSEWFAIDKINESIWAARSIFEQRLNNKENQNG